VQRFVDADFEQHYFTLLEDPAHHPVLRTMAAFDVVANNADRKGGHCLIDTAGHVWGIDHGVCFHMHPKLRTVIWDFGGEALPAGVLDDILRLVGCPPAGLEPLLSDSERAAITKRAAGLARRGALPDPSGARPYPWPLV
jgi:uncharacterized repeat protein (TIGR03843 family)